ncbi:MAG: GDYXXLXY domain-containing protein [Candidatus Melainabacteria bacterium]|jgi:uncharacterized membrane-anchored protein|nr:GDYXXLXY domain-containing protein [Candidatus Melainabacteria bacterium]
MKMKQVILTVLALWGIGILTIVVSQEQHLASGKEVLLKTVPVDPRDLFKGDYVTLSYDINAIDLRKITVDKPSFKEGDLVFVTLDTTDSTHIAKPIKFSHTAPKGDLLFIQGKVNYSTEIMHITYEDIERYYVPEGTGGVIEQARGKSVLVKVALNSEGKPLIKQVLIDGKPFSPSIPRTN